MNGEGGREGLNPAPFLSSADDTGRGEGFNGGKESKEKKEDGWEVERECLSCKVAGI